MKQDTTKILFYAVIAIALISAFKSVGQSVSNLLGIDTPEKKSLDAQAVNPSSFWDAKYWKTFANAKVLTMVSAERLCRDLYDCFGIFNDDEERAIAILKTVKYKTQVSFLSEVFQKLYQQDLLTFLRGGVYPVDRLSDADVALINSYYSKLPNL